MDDLPSTPPAQPDEGQKRFSALMEQVRLGSQQAAEELWREYGAYVVHIVRRSLHQRVRSKFDSQDFAQAAWASFFTRLPEASQFETPAALAGFLAKIARNKVITQHRRLYGPNRNVEREQPLDNYKTTDAMIDPRLPTPSQEAVADELVERLTEDQPPLFSRIVEMRRAGLTTLEIADREKTSERSVRRALARLKELLAERWRGARG